MHYVYHRSGFSHRMIQIVGSLASEHMIGILGLAERIVYTAPIRIGMIAALMVKRMPLGSAIFNIDCILSYHVFFR